eukprot:CAMPEP_0196782582 /NCGR_PEP_ID=MMETSP1104-20130614/11642_1 /TAXON_ID=33652 /ORGANISM="Cafeteria sp., Strain Caron Lab Isolate" /LENGTH=114 /DNA_ID=CAMNT_0042152821 /DNA_START=22 /DNA_END=366 /DNA_ORIENTATION=+
MSLARFSAPHARSAQRMFARGMATGTVKWFNVKKGFGFIIPDDDENRNLFVHWSAVQGSGFRFLRDGERVSYEVQSSERGDVAANVTDVDGKAFERESPERFTGRTPYGGEGSA